MVILGQQSIDVGSVTDLQGEDGGVLGIKQISQIGTDWCWAACGEMVARYLKVPNVRQCVLVNHILPTGFPDACQDPKPADRFACNASQIASVYAECGIACSMQGTLSPRDVENQILSQKRPVMVMLYYYSGELAGGFHSMLLSGIDLEGNVFAIDPRADTVAAKITWDALVTGHGAGKWEYSWVDFKKKERS